VTEPSSLLVLGTAQLGGAYGIANSSGAPSQDAAVAMVEAALEGGIDTFDTASGYGASEDVLGRALATLGVAEDVHVVTKVLAMAPEVVADESLARAAIEASLEHSRERLGLTTLSTVLFHREEDAAHLSALAELRRAGWCQNIGVSVGNFPGLASELARTPEVDAVQVPLNVFDRRHLEGGTLAAAQHAGVTVYVRSVFLQGLVLMPEERIHPLLRDIIPTRRAVHALAAEAGLSPAEFAVRYVLAQPGDVRLVLGAETVEQVRANVALASGGPLPADLVAATDVVVGDLRRFLVTPNDWVGRIPPGS
jgi:aryl-alcohol dehydrogenase-like predicted oxidoreductase